MGIQSIGLIFFRLLLFLVWLERHHRYYSVLVRKQLVHFIAPAVEASRQREQGLLTELYVSTGRRLTLLIFLLELEGVCLQ